MSEKIEVIEESSPDESPHSVADGLRRILMAGLGSIKLGQSEVESFVNRLVDKGQLRETDARGIVSDFLAKSKKQAEDTSKWVESEVERRMEQLLNQLNVPTKSDIDLLMQKVADLSEKLDQLQNKD